MVSGTRKFEVPLCALMHCSCRACAIHPLRVHPLATQSFVQVTPLHAGRTPPRPPREGARLPHPPCLRPARVTVICLIHWCSASSPDASPRSRARSLRRGAGAPPPPPTGRRWGYFLRVFEGAQQPLCLELGPNPPLLGRAALC